MIISEIFVMKINITGLDRHFQMCKKDLGYSGNKIVTNKKKKKLTNERSKETHSSRDQGTKRWTSTEPQSYKKQRGESVRSYLDILVNINYLKLIRRYNMTQFHLTFNKKSK